MSSLEELSLSSKKRIKLNLRTLEWETIAPEPGHGVDELCYDREEVLNSFFVEDEDEYDEVFDMQWRQEFEGSWIKVDSGLTVVPSYL